MPKPLDLTNQQFGKLKVKEKDNKITEDDIKSLIRGGAYEGILENDEKKYLLNIFDFNEDIYGLDLEISFIEKIRDEKRFASLSELAVQLEADRDRCLSLIQDSYGNDYRTIVYSSSVHFQSDRKKA